MKIVGIGGMPRSGKDTLADLLIERGWFGLSFGDVVRDFARKRHINKPDPISVVNMTETSNWLRETYGPDVILQKALEQYETASIIKDYQGLVLYSVRAPVEADWILAHSGELVWVEATDEVRHRRNLVRRRDGEAVIDLKEFKRQEALQWQPQPGIPVEIQMNIAYVKARATKTLDNSDSNLEAFKVTAIKLLCLSQ